MNIEIKLSVTEAALVLSVLQDKIDRCELDYRNDPIIKENIIKPARLIKFKIYMADTLGQIFKINGLIRKRFTA